jgi:hypothetical protein
LGTLVSGVWHFVDDNLEVDFLMVGHVEVNILTVCHLEVDILTVCYLEVDILTVCHMEVDILMVGNLEVDILAHCPDSLPTNSQINPRPNFKRLF